jgi:hypothetical protein
VNRLRLVISATTAALAVGLISIAISSLASARPGVQPAVRSVTSPPEPGLTLGLSGADDQLASGGASGARWTTKAEHEGAKIVRLAVTWSSIAPTSLSSGFDPSSATSPDYNWTSTDQAVLQLSREGFTTLIEIQVAPAWAEGANVPKQVKGGSWEPNAKDFGEFATAIATRYDGHTPNPTDPGQDLPKVSDWQAWNEPNLTGNLTPQWEYEGSQAIPESPGIYRKLENAFYKSVTAVAPSNFVIAAGTAPYGDPPGGGRMAPITFDRYLLCLNGEDRRSKGCPGPTYLDAIDDHPYVSHLCCHGPTWHAASPYDTAPADVYKIDDLLKAAEAAKTVAPAGPKQFWVTEIGWNTDPPDPISDRGSPAATVGRWATQLLYGLWSQGVSTVMWYQLVDDPEAPGGWAQSFTEGLYYLNGTAKPAARAFAFPFMTNRKTKTTVEAWGRAPEAGTLSIQEKHGRRWVSILKLEVKADQVFEAPIALAGSRSFRAEVRGDYSPPWLQAA